MTFLIKFLQNFIGFTLIIGLLVGGILLFIFVIADIASIIGGYTVLIIPFIIISAGAYHAIVTELEKEGR